jgi:hypothetical protein
MAITRPNIVQRIVGRIQELFTTQTNALSVQLRHTSMVWARRLRSSLMQPTKDWNRSDYAWWRNAYYGRTRGLELSSLFLKPIVSKLASWTLGMGVGWKLESETAQTALTDWWAAHHSDIMRAMRGSLKQGDAWLVVNADLSVTVLPPDTVDPIVAPDDYGLIIGWRVTQVLAHPETTARMTLIDEYYADRRIQTMTIDGRQQSATTYPNLLGRLQIVHIANALDEGDSFGHPEAEALVELLLRYNTVLEAAIDGNERQGRPTPVLSFESVTDLDKFWADYGTRESRTLPDGTTEQVTTIGVDLTQILTVSGAQFQYASPGSFVQDTEKLLGLLFYLLLEHAEIPEFVFGNAIASSMASANVQMPVFSRFIDGRRQDAAGWLVQIAEIVLGYLSLITPGLGDTETPTIQWSKLSQDEKLTLETLTWAFTEGLIDERTALMLAPIDVTDITTVLAKAKAERAERMGEAQSLLPQPLDDTNFDQGDQDNGTTEDSRQS